MRSPPAGGLISSWLAGFATLLYRDMKIPFFLLLLTLSALVHAQVVQYEEPDPISARSSRLSCERADVGRGVGHCTEHVLLDVTGALSDLDSAQFECSVTWELEKDQGKADFLDITTTVDVELHHGNGHASFDTSRDLGNVSDPVRRIRRSTTRCISTSY
jgi:hypothetical protein